MKKIYKYIMTVAIVLMGLLQFTSCNDANDWTVDSSVLRQRQPSSFKVELNDVKTLAKKITIGTVAGATSYEIQMSTAPLSSNGNVPEGAEINTAIVNMTSEGDLELDEESMNLPSFEQGKTYYFRVRAIGEDGTKSNWYTNGSVYNGGVSDATLEQKLIENTYKYDSDKNSYSVVTVPTLAWIDGADVDENVITVRWHEIKYAKIKYLRNDADPENLIDISSVGYDPASDGSEYAYNENTRAYHYDVTGLESGKEYTFTILAEDGETVLGTASASTEPAPNMNLARSILTWTRDQVIGQKGVPLTLVDPVQGDFKVILNQDNAANAGWNTSGSTYYCQTPDKKVYTTQLRFQSKNRNSITFEVPADGRLYLYANGSPTTYTVTQEGEEDKEITVKKDNKESIIDDEGKSRNCIKFVKVALKKGTATITPTASASCYYYGFVFVPYEETPASDTPSADQPTE